MDLGENKIDAVSQTTKIRYNWFLGLTANYVDKSNSTCSGEPDQLLDAADLTPHYLLQLLLAQLFFNLA